MPVIEGFYYEFRMSRLICSVNHFLFHSIYSATEHAFKKILTSLPKPGGGEFGKFYSLPALNDPRIGMYIKFTEINYTVFLLFVFF